MLPYAFKHKLPFIPVLDIFEGCIGGQPRTASWWTGGWSSCSAECGGGQQTRDVICKIDGEDAPNNLVYLCDLYVIELVVFSDIIFKFLFSSPLIGCSIEEKSRPPDNSVIPCLARTFAPLESLAVTALQALV